LAIDGQVAWSQGLALFGQQSMSSIEDISVISADLTPSPATPAAGSIATETAINSAKIDRQMLMGVEDSRFCFSRVK